MRKESESDSKGVVELELRRKSEKTLNKVETTLPL